MLERAGRSEGGVGMFWELLRSVGGQGDEPLCLWRLGAFSPQARYRQASRAGLRAALDRAEATGLQQSVVRPTSRGDAQKNCAQGPVDGCLEYA